MRPDIRPGARFPDYELPDQSGTKRRLSELQDLRGDLREVTKRIRKDWDLGKPGMREAWERGDKSGFWPYGKSMKEVFAKTG